MQIRDLSPLKDLDHEEVGSMTCPRCRKYLSQEAMINLILNIRYIWTLKRVSLTKLRISEPTRLILSYNIQRIILVRFPVSK